MNTGSLMLECGTKPVSYDELRWLDPSHHKPLTPTHRPTPHYIMRNQVVSSLQKLGQFEITKEEIGISHKGKRCFGILELKQKDREMYEDYCMVYVWRNSNDFAFRGSVGTGSKVFNCDNLALVAEWVVGAKHTLNVNNMLVSRLDTLNETLKEQGLLMHEKYARYKNTSFGQPIADHIVFNAVRAKALPKTKILAVDKEWNNPSYKYEGSPWSAWKLFNAFTHVNKGLNYVDQIVRTQKLHKVFDDYLGMGENHQVRIA